MKRKSDIENARLALGLADTSAVDKVSGSALSLARSVFDVLIIIYLCVEWMRSGAGETFVIPASMKAVGTVMSFVCARRGVFNDSGYTVQSLGSVIYAVMWTFLTVSLAMVIGLDADPFWAFLALAVIYHILVFRAVTAVKDSLYLTPSAKKPRKYSRALVVAVAVITVVLYGALIYNYLIAETVRTPIARALHCLSAAEMLGIDPFTPFLLIKYRHTFDE